MSVYACCSTPCSTYAVCTQHYHNRNVSAYPTLALWDNTKVSYQGVEPACEFPASHWDQQEGRWYYQSHFGQWSHPMWLQLDH